MCRQSLSLVFVFFLFALGTVHCATIYVPDDYATIQGAIAASVNGDTVIVRPATYVENIDFIGKAITVKSEQGPNVTTIDGNMAGSVVTFQSAEGTGSILDGFTVTNGTGTFFQGALSGGGIFCPDTSPTIRNNIISKNTAYSGGGFYCSNFAPRITNNLITLNTGDLGGGISCGTSSPTITNNTITINTATLEGGGIYGYRFSPTITNTILWNNSAPNGPEIFDYQGSPTVTYCDVAGGWPGPGNIDADPLFVPLGDCYLSQIAAGQPTDSPCVNVGVPPMITGTTRTDNVQDAGVVDMGYHYPIYTPVFTLAVSPDPLIGGSPASFIVTGGKPVTMTYLVYSLTGPGNKFVPLLNVYLGVLNPKLFANDFTDILGAWTYYYNKIPEAPGLSVWIQAAQQDQASNVVETSIQ